MAINISSISYAYPETDDLALQDVSININEGEIVGIIGHTGSGKSTFLQHLNGLIIPNSGSVVIDEINTNSKNLLDVRRKVGLVFQYPEHQLFAETCYDDIAYGLRNIGLGEDEIKKRIFEGVELIGLKPSVLKVSPFEISGGQKRKVALAGVIAMRPRYLVLDEPTSGLDPQSRNDLFKTIIKLRDEGMTIVLASHSMDDVAKYVDRVVAFCDGRIIVDAPVKEAFADVEILKKVGIKLPQVTEFYNELACMAGLNSKIVLTEDEAFAEICSHLK